MALGTWEHSQKRSEWFSHALQPPPKIHSGVISPLEQDFAFCCFTSLWWCYVVFSILDCPCQSEVPRKGLAPSLPCGLRKCSSVGCSFRTWTFPFQPLWPTAEASPHTRPGEGGAFGVGQTDPGVSCTPPCPRPSLDHNPLQLPPP